MTTTTTATKLTDDELLELLALPANLRGQALEAEVQVQLSPEEARFQEETRTSLGGTAVAAICGLSSYRNAWDVAAEHKGILPPFRGTERTSWGKLLEEPVLKEYARRTGYQVEKGSFVRDPEKPHRAGHLDGAAPAKRKVVEVKTVEFGREKWSDPGQPLRVPPDYYVQAQWYCGVTRFESCDLVAMFGLSKMRWYELEANARVIAALREKADEFWERYIVGNELPPIEPSDRAVEWLKGRHPAPANEVIVVANEAQAEAIARWQEAKKQREEFEAEEEKWKLHVQAAIGDAMGIVASSTTVTWKKNKDTLAYVTDWEAILRALSVPVPAELIVAHSKTVVTRIGPRVLRVKENA
jgi:predicted phage-related endonuclease